MRHPGFNSSLSLLSATIVSIGPVFSAEHTWTGGVPFSTGPEFSLPQNWNAAGVPLSEKNTDLLFGTVSGSGRVNPQQNLAAPLMLNQITFAEGAPSFTLAGQSLNPVQDSDANPARVVQNSGVTQTVQTPLNLSLQPLQLTGGGTGPLVISGAISGPGLVQARYPQTVLNGANTQERGTEIGIEAATVAEAGQAGTVTLGHAQALGGGTSKVFPNWRLTGASAVQAVSSQLHFLPYTSAATAGLATTFLGTAGGSGELDFTAPAVVSADRTLHVDNARTTFSGGLHMGGSWQKSGPGTLRLAGATTLPAGSSPVLTVAEGTLEITHASALQPALSVHLGGVSSRLSIGGGLATSPVLRRLTGNSQSQTTLGAAGLKLSPAADESVTYDGILKGNGKLYLDGQSGSLLRLTNWSSILDVNGPQPLNVMEGAVVNGGTLELSGGAWLDLASASTASSANHILVAGGAALRVSGGSLLQSSGEALLLNGATATVTGSNSIWRHLTSAGTPGGSMISVGDRSGSAPMARLNVENGGSVETEWLVLDAPTSPAETDPALLHIGHGSSVRTKLFGATEHGLATTIQGGTLETEEIGSVSVGKIALGDGGRLRLRGRVGTSSPLRAILQDLPAPSPGQPVPGHGFIDIESGSYWLDDESSFSGKVSMASGSSLTLENNTMPDAVFDLAAGTVLLCKGPPDWQLGGLSGAGALDLIASGTVRKLTLGSDRMDADFSGTFNGFTSLIKQKSNRQTWRGYLTAGTLEVQGGTFELGNDSLFATSGTATQTALIVGGTAATARLEINNGATVTNQPYTTTASLITGVEGTGVSITTAGSWKTTGHMEIGRAISPGLPDAGGCGELTLSQSGQVQAGADITVGSIGGKGQLTLTDGGSVLLWNTASLRIGSTPLNGLASTGSVSISGNNSKIDATNFTVYLGAEAPRPANSATLNIGPGGRMVCGTLALRRSADSITVNQGRLSILGIDQSPDSQPAITLTDAPGIGSEAALHIGGGDGTLSLNAGIHGTGSLEKTGSSLLLLYGDVDYTGRTIINGGGIQLHTPLTTTRHVTVHSGSMLLSGRPLGHAGTITTIGPQGRLAEPGTVHGSVNNAGLVEVGGMNSFLLFTGTVTNTGLMRFTRGAKLISSGTFINRGIIDVISGEFIPPPGFVNEGIILDRHSVRISAIRKTGHDVRISIESLTGHSYQLERLPSLNGTGAVRLPLVQEGSTGTTLHFDDTPPAGASRMFYRVLVDP